MARHKNKRQYEKVIRILYSIIFACIVYSIFSMYNKETRKVSVPITIVANEKFVNNSNLPRLADIIIKGDRDLIYSIDVDKINAKINLDACNKEGIYTLPLKLEYDLGIIDSTRVEIYAKRKNIRVSMIKRSN